MNYKITISFGYHLVLEVENCQYMWYSFHFTFQKTKLDYATTIEKKENHIDKKGYTNLPEV